MPRGTSWTPQGSDASTVAPCTKRKPWAVTNWCASSHLEVTQIGHNLNFGFQKPGTLPRRPLRAAKTSSCSRPDIASQILAPTGATSGRFQDILDIFILVHWEKVATRCQSLFVSTAGTRPRAVSALGLLCSDRARRFSSVNPVIIINSV